MALDAEYCCADCHSCSVAFMLSVTSKLTMLSVVMLNIVMLKVAMLNVVAPSTPLSYQAFCVVIAAPAQ